MNPRTIFVLWLAIIKTAHSHIQTWTVDDKNFKMISVNLNDFNDLESSSSYIVRHQESWKAQEEGSMIYYWVGKKSPRRIAAYAAYHALEMDSEKNADSPLPMCVRLRREAEGVESSLFRELFPQRSIGELEEIIEQLHENIGRNATRMFLVEKRGHNLFLREVKIELEAIIRNHENCLVLSSSDDVYVHCGAGVTWRQKEKAKEVARIMLSHKGLKKDAIIICLGESLDEITLRKFIEEYKNSAAVTPQHTITDEPIDLFSGRTKSQRAPELPSAPYDNLELQTIAENKQPKFLETFYLGGEKLASAAFSQGVYYKASDELPKGAKCVLIDSKGPLGIFLWMSNNADIDLRTEAIGTAEEYLEDENYAYTTPITFVAQSDLPQDVKNFRDLYLQLRRRQPDQYYKSIN